MESNEDNQSLNFMEKLYILSSTLLKKTSQQSTELPRTDYQEVKGGSFIEASVILLNNNHFFLQNIKNNSFLNGFIFKDHASLQNPKENSASTKCSDRLEEAPDAALDLIKDFEGFESHAYVDPLSGNLPITIGYGSTKKADGSAWYIGESISREEATKLLRKQVSEDYVAVLKATIPTWNKFNDSQKSALISFAYNLGANFYNSPDFPSMTSLVNNFPSKEEVQRVFLLYINKNTSVEAGLRRRRKAEADLFNS